MTPSERSCPVRWTVACAAALFLVSAVGCEAETPVVVPPPKAPTTQASSSEDALRDRIDRAIELTSKRVLKKDTNNAWQVVHGIIAYGPQLQMVVDGQKVSALRYLFDGNTMNGWVLFPGQTKDGLDAQLVPGSSSAQGHPDQWIGYFACCGVKLDEPIVVQVAGQPKTYQFRNMLSEAQWKIHEGMEATWTLMALSPYVGEYMKIDDTWKARDGKGWNLEQIVEMEADAGIEGAACGGAHRLYALASALKAYRAAGKVPTAGGWAAAEELVNNSIANAFKFQQPDGGFSNDRFFRSSITPDIDERIDSTGHVLEVVAYAVPDDKLSDPKLVRAVEFLCKKIEESKAIPIGCGGLYHGVHGLMIYRERRFGKPTPTAAE